MKTCFFLPNVTTPTCFFSKFHKNEKSLQPNKHIYLTGLKHRGGNCMRVEFVKPVFLAPEPKPYILV